ncbi:sigma-70 family RNA polymerase sigma factor [Streptomyces sp. CSDS2]|uniref:sigma-70 family RNA polymerase sigma factor n=1 Tax=Streptomyces sp. CSDS2 TaxID=3055051 RepID=UPI0025B26762|nr:sigma-70 family RNA polymerase sigma factor [Streptomyces sp. CSDS2]MDN3258866.1 sigma-70 family RNA polymerase sigma factor [Streptomyces sp. CSDS2]
MRTQHTVDTAALVDAARAGDPAAQDALVGAYLPLVYNIVGRALNGSVDVDDVVQETMLRALGSLGDLRTPENFRSWLVAIAMNRVRAHWRDRQLAPATVEEATGVADPGADFVDLTIVRLQLSGQRQETARATRWLEPEDREVLSLWWLECAGELTRAEVATALGVTPQHTAVRVQRMKARLESARVVVRALDTRPACAELGGVLASWDGLPSALWRKRIARHARECARCGGLWSGLLPAEGLLAGLALVAVSSALTAATRSAVAAGLRPTAYAGTAAPDAGGTGPDAAHTGSEQAGDGFPHPRSEQAGEGLSRTRTEQAGEGLTRTRTEQAGPVGVRASRRRTSARGEARRRRRVRRRAVGGAVVAACVAGGGLWYFGTGTGPDTREATPAPTADAFVADLSAPSPVRTSAPPSASPSPSPSRSKKPSPAESPRPARTTGTPKAQPSAPAPATPSPSRTAPRTRPAPAGTVAQVVALVNEERAAAGCGPVTEDPQLERAAQGHSDDMAARGFFDHTNPDGAGPGERVTAAGYRWSTYGENIARGQRTPRAVMDSWMHSPGHRANILNCSFKNIGVGVHNGSGGPWWTQNFGAKL